MNPLRALFLSLSKMPPVVLLLIIIGIATLITMQVVGSVKDEQSSRNCDNQSTVTDPNRKVKEVVYSLTYIPAGSKILRKQVTLREADELDVFDDAQNSVASVVGVIPPKAIPAHAQLRRVDLDSILH